MQAYAPRDPLGEFLAGGITFRQLRVMIDGLARDPSSPLGRAIGGPWDDTNHLLNGIVWELRVLVASFANSKRAENTPSVEPTFPTFPEPTWYQRRAKKKAEKATKTQRAAEDHLLAVLAPDEIEGGKPDGR